MFIILPGIISCTSYSLVPVVTIAITGCIGKSFCCIINKTLSVNLITYDIMSVIIINAFAISNALVDDITITCKHSRISGCHGLISVVQSYPRGSARVIACAVNRNPTTDLKVSVSRYTLAIKQA